ncbi:hypothetical protein [Mesoterricola sediminis]|uniref:Uncharacterized protein n=1 Tax=Mesoterricola sediminis TaxID=2927980 RepID=A0AA48HFI6_9BACT|nr:hypothetical protein [Mesoterricola sediminis]BDU77298.1 hypothetical protein METESE_22560 [Mesoterricola sediminis]
MHNIRIMIMGMAVLATSHLCSQSPVYYRGIIRYPLEVNFRPLPPGDGGVDILPPEQFPTDLRSKEQGEFTLFYLDDTIETFPCIVEARELEKNGFDNENNHKKGKAMEAWFWALVPRYKPARGYRLMKGGILVREKYFPQSEQAPSIDFKEEATESGLKIHWTIESGKAMTYHIVRRSVDEGKTWSSIDIPGKGYLTKDRNEFEIPSSDLEKNAHPILDFWAWQNLVMTRFQYQIGSGKLPQIIR